MAAVYYQNVGRVCGDCGHRHRSAKAAGKCAKAHSKGCVKQGGYSDRSLYKFQGKCLDPLTPLNSEYEEWADVVYGN